MDKIQDLFQKHSENCHENSKYIAELIVSGDLDGDELPLDPIQVAAAVIFPDDPAYGKLSYALVQRTITAAHRVASYITYFVVGPKHIPLLKEDCKKCNLDTSKFNFDSDPDQWQVAGIPIVLDPLLDNYDYIIGVDDNDKKIVRKLTYGYMRFPFLGEIRV